METELYKKKFVVSDSESPNILKIYWYSFGGPLKDIPVRHSRFLKEVRVGYRFFLCRSLGNTPIRESTIATSFDANTQTRRVVLGPCAAIYDDGVSGE